MKMLIRLATVICAVGNFSPVPALALNVISLGSVSNNYLFIEDAIDSEYSITPSALDPCFSGPNTWIEYDTSQVSLGYLGFVGWTAPGYYYQDMWIDNSPINGPFWGVHCYSGTQCPSTELIVGLGTDRNGFYHTQVGSVAGVIDGAYGFASPTDTAHEYFRNVPTDSSEIYVFSRCYTSVNYDYSSRQRCKGQSTGSWDCVNYTLTKHGHLPPVSTNAFQESQVASDGTLNITKGSDYCGPGVVGGTDGVTCETVSYNSQQTVNLIASLTFRASVDMAMPGFTPGTATMRYSESGANWCNYDTSTAYYNVFTASGEYIYIFLSEAFLKKFVDSGAGITGSQPFTFGFYNGLTPESEHCQFTPSLQLNIMPGEYGISVISSDNSTSVGGSGTTGEAVPIEMDYTVMALGSCQADSIAA